MRRWQQVGCVAVLCAGTAMAQVPTAAQSEALPTTTAQFSDAVQAPREGIGPRPLAPEGAERACEDCLAPNYDLGDIGSVPYTVSGDCGTGGKWYARFEGQAGVTYHWDLCPNVPGDGTGSFDADIKICDASCTIVAGQDGSCAGGASDWLPNDLQWMCPSSGTYYVVIAPYHSYDQHACAGTANDTFTLEYCACAGPYPPNDTCDQLPAYYGGSIPTLTAGVPRTYYGDNRCAHPDCALLGGYNVWEAFTVTGSPTGWDITLDYCGSQGHWGNAWLNLALSCPCAGLTLPATWVWGCSDGNVVMTWHNLPDGTYYYPVLLDPGWGSEGRYQLHVVAIPAPCAASGGCDEYISRVQVGAIDQGSECSNYADYTSSPTTDMFVGTGYPITVTNGQPYEPDQCMVWVDWNKDSDFTDAGEGYALAGSPGMGPYTGTITPPAGTPSGNYRLRVRLTYTGVLEPCGTTTYGEVEDYSINVIVPPPPNDLCVNAQAVSEPYPVAVNGTTEGATMDCHDVLDWEEVWYKVHLPYTSNNVSVRYCGADSIDVIGILYLDACDDCLSWHRAERAAWNNCSGGGGWGIDMWWDGVSGPRDIYIPTDIDPAMAFEATFNVTEAGPSTGACCFVGSICSLLTSAECALSGGAYQGDGTSCNPSPCVCRGDCNCDGQVDFADINAFVDAIMYALYCDDTGANADISGDEPVHVGFEDINPFVDLLMDNPLPLACP